MKNWILFVLLPLVAFAVPFHYPPRGSIAPFVSGDTFRAYCDYAFDEITRPPFHPPFVKRGSTVFVSGEMLDQFFEKVHPRMMSPYILVVHNTDRAIPGIHKKFLEDPKIIAWFTQNQDETVHPKLHTLPIGLENRQWNPTNVEILQRVRAKNLPKIHLLYCNFSVTSYFPERSVVHSLLANAPFSFVSERKNYESFVEDLAASKFVLSPRGNGLDTHRLWETLHAGSFPIVKTSSLDTLYEGLPVVIVQDWSEVTEEFLHRKYEELINKKFPLDKLYTDYWFRWIDSYK